MFNFVLIYNRYSNVFKRVKHLLLQYYKHIASEVTPQLGAIVERDF